jgi:tRNA(Ile2) C34 agmatinyltransferase TiaS
MCHSACLYGDRIYVYGGMKNPDTTLDSISILCLDGRSEDLENCIYYFR